MKEMKESVYENQVGFCQTSVDNSRTLELGPLRSRVACGSPPLIVALFDVASN